MHMLSSALFHSHEIILVNRGPNQQNRTSRGPERTKPTRHLPPTINPSASKTRPLRTKSKSVLHTDGPRTPPNSRPDSRTASQVKPTMVHPSITLPPSLPLVMLDPKRALKSQLQINSARFVAIAVENGGPVTWKSISDTSGKGGNERNVKFPNVNAGGRMTSGLLLPANGRLRYYYYFAMTGQTHLNMILL